MAKEIVNREQSAHLLETQIKFTSNKFKTEKKITFSTLTLVHCGTHCYRKLCRPKQVQEVIRKLNGRKFIKVH